MNRRPNRTATPGVGSRVTVLLLLLCAAAASADVSTMIAPHKLVLNAKGQSQDIQAVLRMTLGSGYVLASYDVGLEIGGVTVAQAFDFRYCYVDDNFLASFDRLSVQEHPVVVALAGSTVSATVRGSYVAVNVNDGTSVTRTFVGRDDMEIVDPDRKTE